MCEEAFFFWSHTFSLALDKKDWSSYPFSFSKIGNGMLQQSDSRFRITRSNRRLRCKTAERWTIGSSGAWTGIIEKIKTLALELSGFVRRRKEKEKGCVQWAGGYSKSTSEPHTWTKKMNDQRRPKGKLINWNLTLFRTHWTFDFYNFGECSRNRISSLRSKQ